MAKRFGYVSNDGRQFAITCSINCSPRSCWLSMVIGEQYAAIRREIRPYSKSQWHRLLVINVIIEKAVYFVALSCHVFCSAILYAICIRQLVIMVFAISLIVFHLVCFFLHFVHHSVNVMGPNVVIVG